MARKATRLLALLGIFFSISFAAQASTVSSLFHQSGDPVIGNPRGSITLVEFFDYQCSHCRDMVSTINSIIHANPNLRVVLKDLPVLGPASEYAARAALAAKRQGKYMQLHNALMRSRQSLTNAVIVDIASDAGINTLLMEKDMSSAAVSSQISANLKLANYLGIPGTPAIIIGATNAKDINSLQFAPGAVSQGFLQKMINSVGQ